jgi:class 3 adenylate cyclase/tetratricopeptide (TPR) repeat protein
MRCGSCDRDNRMGARFCAGCGAELPAGCKQCGAGLPAEAAFCDACGSPVQAAEPSTPAASPTEESRERTPSSYTPRHLADRILTNRSALEGERKHVSVLFADVAGFTAMSESRDPEQVHALMDRFFQLVLDEVHGHEGTVNQFLGDGVMALFGAPVALEEAPRRAVRAALGIQRGLLALEQDGMTLPLRIGIHSGPVVVGRIGDDLRMDYTAVGDTTNLAARLQQLSGPGEIFISDATQRLVQGFFDFEDTGTHDVKGKTQRVHAWRVLRERSGAGRVEAGAETGLTPLVGRDTELAALHDAFRAARDGRGRACFLVGDAGIGKSRLLYEFRNNLAGEPHVWFEGRCASYGSTTAFRFVVDGLQRYFAIEDQDDDASALRKLSEGLAQLGDELAWSEPLLQKLLSLPVSDPEIESLNAAARRSETIRALHAFFLRAAERSPLVLAVEDLHWIDRASEEFLDFLIDSIPAAKILLLLTHRPGYQQPFGDQSYHVRVALQALSAGEMDAMAGSILDSASLPAELRALIVRKAEGNPFFVEEVTKSLLEEGALELSEGRVTLARPLDQISVPDSIQDVLMARIDRLDEEPKRAIQMASVIGREFALRLLERIVEAGQAMHGVVSELRSLELIYQKAAHPELAFMFKHALTHDVAYESVLQQRRRTLHSVVGHAIEELYAERLAEHYEALAHHFELAEEWDRALLFHEHAAAKARDAYANHSAIAHFRSALNAAEKLGASVPDEHRARLAQGIGLCGYCINEFRESGDAFRRAASWSEDPDQQARNLARAAHSYLWGHHYEESADAAGRGAEIAEANGCDAAASIALCALTHQTTTHEGLRSVARDEGPTTSMGRLALSTGDDEAIATVVGQDSLWAELRGNYRDALSLADQALAAAQRIGIPQLIVIPTWVNGLALTCLGEYGPGLASIRHALDLSLRIGDRAMRSRFLNTLGWCFGEFNCHEQASAFNREAARLAQELVDLDLVAGADEILSNAKVNLACNRVALGDCDGALEALAPVQRQLATPGDPWQRWRYGMHLNDALTRVHLARGEPERALPFVDEELDTARDQFSRKLEARALELRGRTLVHLERHSEARQSLEEAVRVARRIGYPPAAWRALSLLGELARRRGEGSEAERLASESSGLVSKLARSLPEKELRDAFGSVSERLSSDPLGAYR